MDREGKPLPEAQLTLVWTRESGGVTSRSARSAVADANRNFLFSRLSVGLHQLRADAQVYVGMKRSARSAPTQPRCLRCWTKSDPLVTGAG